MKGGGNIQSAVALLPFLFRDGLLGRDLKSLGKYVANHFLKEIDPRPLQNWATRKIEVDKRKVEADVRIIDDRRERRSDVVARTDDYGHINLAVEDAAMMHEEGISTISSSIAIFKVSIAVTLRRGDNFANDTVAKAFTLKRRDENALRQTGTNTLTPIGKLEAVSPRRGEGFTIDEAAEVLTLKRRDIAGAHIRRDGGDTENETQVEVVSRDRIIIGGDVIDTERVTLGAGSRAPRAREPKVHTVQAVTTITKSRNLPVHIKWNEAALKLRVAHCLPVVVMTITSGVVCTYRG